MAAESRRDLPVPVPVELRRPDGTTAVEYAVNVSPRGLCLQLSGVEEEVERQLSEYTSHPTDRRR